MAAAAARKLQKEIDTTLKKVDDGIEEFENLWDEAQDNSLPSSQRDKLGDELKKSINKLQRFRVQIREWIAANEVKAKDKLESARKKIEFNMQRFKEFERELKTKAYSTFALAKDDEDDPDAIVKREHQEWCQTMINAINDDIDTVEADIDKIIAKKSQSSRDKDDMEEKNGHIKRHRWHILKLESLLRAIDNDAIEDLEEITNIKESVEYYVEAYSDSNYYHDEELYEAFPDFTQEMEQAASAAVVAQRAAVDVEAVDKCVVGISDKKAKAKKGAADKKARINPAMQSNTGPLIKVKRRPIDDNGEQKITEDQLVPGDSDSAEEFICKICYVHIVGAQPKLTKCSHLFCGDCLAQWFAQHPEIQSWAQRAKTAGDARHTVPCPVCKTALVEETDLDPVCAQATRSENLLLWKMLSSLKVMCINHDKVSPGCKCPWEGEYGQYQEHIMKCRLIHGLGGLDNDGNPLPVSGMLGGSSSTAMPICNPVPSSTTTSSTPVTANNSAKKPAIEPIPEKKSVEKSSKNLSSDFSNSKKDATIEKLDFDSAKKDDDKKSIKCSDSFSVTATKRKVGESNPAQCSKPKSSTASSSTPNTMSSTLKSDSPSGGPVNAPMAPNFAAVAAAAAANNGNSSTAVVTDKSSASQAGGGQNLSTGFNSASTTASLPSATVTSTSAGQTPNRVASSSGNQNHQMSSSNQSSNNNNVPRMNPVSSTTASGNNSSSTAGNNRQDEFNNNQHENSNQQKQRIESSDFQCHSPASENQYSGENNNNVNMSSSANSGNNNVHNNSISMANSAHNNGNSSEGPTPLAHNSQQTQTITSSQSQSTSMQTSSNAPGNHNNNNSGSMMTTIVTGRDSQATMGVAKAEFAPCGENTIEVKPGNKLKIIDEHASGWTFVKNEDLGESGWVPAWVVSRDPKPTASQARTPPSKKMKALANFDGNSENELTIIKGEYVDVVERHSTGWTFGKMENSEGVFSEGWFPDWVVATPNGMGVGNVNY